ncbi:MAG: hypothetical protein QXJ52_01145 [Candidatus Korarchaeota archaeon]
MIRMVLPGVYFRRIIRSVVFDFDEHGILEALLRYPAGEYGESVTYERIERTSIISKIYSTLPIQTEAILLDDVEILIKLPRYYRQKIYRRDHIAYPGQVIYRPQVPAISIAAGLLETYEPVEIIGEVKTVEKQESREYVPREIQELADKIRNRASVYVVIRKSKPETEEDTEGDK